MWITSNSGRSTQKTRTSNPSTFDIRVLGVLEGFVSQNDPLQFGQIYASTPHIKSTFYAERHLIEVGRVIAKYTDLKVGELGEIDERELIVEMREAERTHPNRLQFLAVDDAECAARLGIHGGHKDPTGELDRS